MTADFDIAYSGFTDGEYKYLFQQLRRPMNDEPIDHPLRTLVFEALGAASACWTPGTGTAVFDSEQAIEIGNGLLTTIMERETEVITAAAQAVARCNAYLELLRRVEAILHDIDLVCGPTGIVGQEVDLWRSAYRATLDYPPLADIQQLALDVEGGS